MMSEVELSPLLTEINRLKAEIDSLRPLPALTLRRIMQKLQLEWNYHSNALEGNSLTLGETKVFLEYGITAGGKPFRDYLEIRGHDTAVEFLQSMVTQTEPLTEATIRELHKMILVEPYTVSAKTADDVPTTREIIPGRYKTTPNHAVTLTGQIHFFASPEETPAKMADLVAWYRQNSHTLHPLISAATFHYEFVRIHPFDDGNGRMARLLMNLLFMQAGFPPVIIPTSQKGPYLVALAKVDDDNDFDPFIELVGQALLRSLDIYLRGAKGENIDEPTDLDKEVAILQKKLQAKEKELQQHAQGKKNAQSQFYWQFLRPFLENLYTQLPKFAPVLGNHFYGELSGLKENFEAYTHKNGSFADFIRPFDGTDFALNDNLIVTISGSMFFRYQWQRDSALSGTTLEIKFLLQETSCRITYRVQNITSELGEEAYTSWNNPSHFATVITDTILEQIKRNAGL